MANNLTGDYEAVLQIRTRHVNGFLGTMHQNRAPGAQTPTFPHCARIRVGASAPTLNPKITQFATWVGSQVQAMQLSGESFTDYRDSIQDKAPPGVSKIIAGLFKDVADAQAVPLPHGSIAGWADVQVSEPSISLVDGATSDVTLVVFIRARYQPDDGSEPLPEWIHGKIQATYRIEVLPGGGMLRVHASPNDREILFSPVQGAGLSPAHVDKISDQVRKALRKDFAVADLSLPNFPFSGFKALGSGDGQALALPFQLSGTPVAGGGVGNVGSSFLGTSDFAMAVSKEAISAKFQPTLNALRQYRVIVPVANIGYRVAVTSAVLIFKNGAIDLEIKATATAPWPWPDFKNIVITQRLTLALDPGAVSITLDAPDKDLSITGIPGSVLGYDVMGRVRNRVIPQRDKALPAAKQALFDAFYNARRGLEDAVKSFTGSATVRYVTVEVTPDGVLVRGRILTVSRKAPVVVLDPIPGGNDFSAFRSWIPGGRITEYAWSWLERTSPIPWHNKVKSEKHANEFIFTQPTLSITAVPGVPATGPMVAITQTFKITPITRICFGFTGTRISPEGDPETGISADLNGKSCANTSFEPILTVPPYAVEAIIPELNLPLPAENVILNDIVGAHVNAFGQSRQPGAITANALIHFTGPRIEQPLELLGRALTLMRHRDRPLLAIVVLPMGTFRERVGEIEARLGSPGEGFGAHLIITEDYAEGWTKAFDARETPSSHLINARGELAWSARGRLNIEALAGALDEHLLQAPAAGTVMMQLNVKPGEPALPAYFDDDQGHRHLLHRMRGRRVLLNFWKSWSAPCLRELQALQRLQCEGNAPFVLAINSGEDRSMIAQIREEYGLTLPLICDEDRAISIRYGVNCWPTTVSIDEDGVVDRVHFGTTDEARLETPRDETTS